MEVTPWICSRVWTPGAERGHNWLVPKCRNDSIKRYAWVWSFGRGNSLWGEAWTGVFILVHLPVWPWRARISPRAFIAASLVWPWKPWKVIWRTLMLSWRSRRVIQSSSCFRNSDTISRKRRGCDRENPGGIYRPVKQPHRQLSIGKGSNKMAEENRSLRQWSFLIEGRLRTTQESCEGGPHRGR